MNAKTKIFSALFYALENDVDERDLTGLKALMKTPEILETNFSLCAM
ncbi:MAG: hypothetical protein VB050_01065 [Geobacteraceae bacterium]|nr:hypothetical protein [Geobacteraceae bacterium]